MALNDADLFLVNQGGQSKKITYANLKSNINADEALWELDGSTIQPKEDTHDVEIGGGDIQLNANGNGSFSGDVVTSARFSSSRTNDTDQAIIVQTAGQNRAVWRAGGELYISTNDNPEANPTVRIRPIGQIVIGGTVDAVAGISLAVQDTAGNNQITLSPDGSASFAGEVKVGPNSEITLNTNGVVETQGSYRVMKGADIYGQFFTSDGFDRLGITGYNRGVFISSNSTGSAGVVLNRDAFGWVPSNSESRLKNILGDVDKDQAWDLVKNIELKRYQYKDQEDKAVSYAGPMADWLGKQDPELLIDTGRSDEEGPIHTYNAGLLEMKALQALSTALTRIEALEAEVQALKGGN